MIYERMESLPGDGRGEGNFHRGGDESYRDDAKQFGLRVYSVVTKNTTIITVRSFLLVSIDLTFFYKWWIKPGTRTSTDSKKSARNQRGLTVV